MKQLLSLVLICGAALTMLAADRPIGRLPNGTYYVLDEVDFALKEEVARALSPADANRGPVVTRGLLNLHPAIREIVGGHTAARRWLTGQPLPAVLKHDGPEVPPIARSLKARLNAGRDAAQVVAELQQHPDVEWASLNHLHRPDLVPNDARWTEQWGPVWVRANDAWDVPQASTSIRVAIIDTGVDLYHPDLAPRIVYNAGFGPNSNGDAKRDQRGSGDIDHGTHVAGIVGAIRDNGIGIAGIANVGLMAMGCAEWVPSKSEYYICCAADAMLDAISNGADAINCSFGNSGLSFSETIALNLAESGQVLVVCAAGNDGKDVANSGSSGWDEHDWPLIVSNIQQGNSLNPSSNHGSAIDLAAPGTEILSTVTTNFHYANPGGTYGYMSGTSMASPCVAGAAAMVKAMNPALIGGLSVKHLLYRMAFDLGDPGKDPFYGRGLLQLDPMFLKTVKDAAAFVGPNPGSADGHYRTPYPSIAQALNAVGPDKTLVLNGSLRDQPDYHYPAQTFSVSVTLTALPDRPVIIGQ